MFFSPFLHTVIHRALCSLKNKFVRTTDTDWQMQSACEPPNFQNRHYLKYFIHNSCDIMFVKILDEAISVKVINVLCKYCCLMQYALYEFSFSDLIEISVIYTTVSFLYDDV